MTKDEIVSFMRDGSRTGKLAVTRVDGRPLVVPVWFDFDDAEELVLSTTCRRYVGDDRASEFGSRNAVPGEMLVGVSPTDYVGARGVSE